MAFILDAAYDALLNRIQDTANALHICSQEPANRTEAVTTYSLGNKASPTINEPANRSPNGREIEIQAISDGNVTATGTATHWAIVDGTDLLAAGPLSASQAVTNGNPFTLTSFNIGVPDAT
jgi:hypothetical protein